MFQWTLIFALVEAVSPLRLLSLDIPSLVLSGQDTMLSCLFDLEDDILYSIKWYRDDAEFFRYTPSDHPANKHFSLQGINFDHIRSSNVTIYIRDVNVTTSGLYKCEISADAPSFQTVSAQKYMAVEGTDHDDFKAATASAYSTSLRLLHRLPLYCSLLMIPRVIL